MSPHPPDPVSVAFDQHTIETPEQLRLNFAIAGIGSRFLALVIDTLIQTGITIAIVIVFAVLGISGVFRGLGASGLWMAALVAAAIFVLTFGYFAIFEIFWNGQTPGKRALGIRVVKDSGRPLTAAETIGRNLMRIVDQMPGCYAIGMLFAIISTRGKRLGDLVAGSLVVRDSAIEGMAPVWEGVRPSSSSAAGAAGMTIEDLRLIESFLNRRSELAGDVRARMAAQIADQLRAKLPLSAEPGVSNESLLESLAWERRSTGDWGQRGV